MFDVGKTGGAGLALNGEEAVVAHVLQRGEVLGEVYAAFAQDESKTNSYLALSAKLGDARCQALAGDKDGAVKALDALKATLKDDKLAEARIERLTDAIKRYEPGRSPRSLFDAADAAEKSLAAEAKPAAPAAKPAAK